ncbi:efflux pump antibiotic resistance protein, putative [Talaromyces stipitatus ATCC 10500]|uniref:Efflux pump antibiotic resistance protein, putative n=1 Tax=Talaromyces stipitatus (strain ATCC 10500 / CBS 375.48 / QM 6759 / NRRL 1006) TaxID=441959 RepID=B8MGY0_TALSN|nr:efflux pump antibiotic resistance protein, putative [Talaromyces stipitatus ATCC 10500]EED16361.1 efflux pump antibiotic resistance protein, putative [Talaromyces stipitatus ATCC 10500]
MAVTDAVPVNSTDQYEKGDTTSTSPAHSSGNNTDIEKSGDDIEPVTTAAEEEDPHPVKGFKWWLLLVAIYSTTFLYGLDNTIVADVQGSVVERFGQVAKLSWIGTGFPLGSVAVIMPFGFAFGTFNNKWVYIMSLVIFSTGSAICGGAPNMDALIVGRVIAGAGGAGQYLGVLNLITRFTTMQERSHYMGMTGLTWGAGTILGPVIGGAFADSSATWRWAFYLNLVIYGVFSPIYFLWLPSIPVIPEKSFIRKFLAMDWVGITLNAGIYLTWVMALTFGGSTYAWNAGQEIALWVVFGVLLIAFCLQQYFLVFTSTKQRIFPGHFLKRRTLVLCFIATNCAATSFFVIVYYLPIYFEFVHSDGGLKSAVRLLPVVSTFVFWCIASGTAMPYVGYYFPWYVVSGILIAVGGGLMYTVDISTATSAIYGYSVLIGCGGGAIMQAAYSIGPAKVIPVWEDIPPVIGFINVGQIGGIMHSLAISGAVFQNYAFRYVSEALADLHLTTGQIQSAIAGTDSTVLQSLDPAQQALATQAIVHAMQKVYILILVAGAVCFTCGVLMRRERLFMEKAAAG